MVEIQRLRVVPAHCESATALFERISEILTLIPEDLHKKDEFEESLIVQRGLIFHTPTERMCGLWQKTKEILDDILLVDSKFGERAYVILKFVQDD